ncbi:MAG: L,D-transpeptidase family protein [Rhodothermales bacterium]
MKAWLTSDLYAFDLNASADSISTALHGTLPDSTSQVARLYEANNYGLHWIENDGTLRPHAEALIEALPEAERHGLSFSEDRLNDLRTRFEEARSHASLENVIALDLALSDLAIQFGTDLRMGRVNPQNLKAEVYIKASSDDFGDVLSAWMTEPEPPSFTETFAPDHPIYLRLQEALQRYRQYAKDGGWETVAEGADDLVLEIGETSPYVPALRNRLALAGNLASSSEDSTYDVNVAAAVADFQERHGLAVDSVLGPNTLAALNVPIDARILQLELALERWRWLPHELADRFILTNVPGFNVYAIENNDNIALEMRTVVGAAYGDQETPVLADTMTYVDFRPYWNVPDGIAANEIMPKVREDASYLDQKQYEIVSHFGSDATVYDVSEVDLDEIPGQYHIRQRPGPHNSLGLVKFMFPNEHAIYLHDTPADALFDRAERDFSHGCVRLAEPDRFGAYILGRQGWDLARVQDAMQSGDHQIVSLEEPIPVYIMYLSAFAEPDGYVTLHDDIYGQDADLATRLNANATDNLAAHAETLASLLQD